MRSARANKADSVQFRQSLAEQHMQNTLSSQEVIQGQSNGSSGSSGGGAQWEDGAKNAASEWDFGNEPLQDPLIYPGLYAPSGIDMMGILVRIVYLSDYFLGHHLEFVFRLLLSIFSYSLLTVSSRLCSPQLADV